MGSLGLLLSGLFAAGPSLSPLPISGLEAEYAVEGVINEAYRIDAGGQALTLILSRTGNFRVDNDDARSARLYATLYAETADGHQQRWLIQDRVDACVFDITAAFTAPPVAVSDADADGEPEIWVSYRTACRSDVSPATLKLIGYEGSQKYALRGTARINLGDSSDGGTYQADAALIKAPALLKQADQLWMAVRDDSF